LVFLKTRTRGRLRDRSEKGDTAQWRLCWRAREKKGVWKRGEIGKGGEIAKKGGKRRIQVVYRLTRGGWGHGRGRKFQGERKPEPQRGVIWGKGKEAKSLPSHNGGEGGTKEMG